MFGLLYSGSLLLKLTIFIITHDVHVVPITRTQSRICPGAHALLLYYDVTKGVIVNMIVCLRGPGWQHHCLYLRASVVWACRRLCSSEGVGKQPPRGKEFTTSTSSLRVDAVAAAGLDIARKYA